MTLPAVVRVVSTTSITATGTQDFTSNGLGTPDGVLVMASSFTSFTAQGTTAPGYALSWGVSDGTTEFVASNYSRDNVATSFCKLFSKNDKILSIKDPATSLLAFEAEFDSFITDGVRLNFTTILVAVPIYITVVLFAGTNCQVHTFEVPGTLAASQPATVTAGFEPDFVLTHQAANDLIGTEKNGTFFDFGIAHNNGSDDNFVAGGGAMHNVATSSTRRYNGSDEIALSRRYASGGAGTDIVAGGTFIDNYTATGFDVQAASGATAPVIGIAVTFGGDLEIATQTRLSQTSTGTESISGLLTSGKKAGFVYLGGSTAANANQYTNFMGVNVAATDFGQTGSFALHDQHNAATANTGMTFLSGFLNAVLNHASGNAIIASNRLERIDTGYEIDWFIANGTARAYNVLVIENQPYTADTTATMPSMGASATAELEFRVNGTATMPALGVDADVLQVFRTQVTTELAAVQVEAVAELLVTASTSVVLPSIQASATAEQIFRTQVQTTLPAVTADALVTLGVSGAVAVDLPALAANVTALEIFRTQANVDLPAMTVTALAEVQDALEASANVTLPSLLADATALEIFRTQVELALPALSADALVQLGTTGTVAVTLPALQAALVADLVFRVQTDATLPSLQVAALADLGYLATTTAGLPSLGASILASLVFRTQVTATMPSMEVAANAAIDIGFEAVATTTLPAITVDVDAELELDRDAAVDLNLPALQASALVDLVFTTNASVEMPSVTAALTADEIFRTQIEPTLPFLDVTVLGETLATTFVDANLPAMQASATALEIFRTETTVGLPSFEAFLTNTPLLACDTELEGQAATATTLLGRADDATSLAGRADDATDLEGRADDATSLGGRYDDRTTLEGGTC